LLTQLTPPEKPAHGMSYDSVGLLESYTPPALSLVPNVATSYAHDPSRRRAQTALPDGRIVNQVHDAAGRLSRTELPGAEGVIERTHDDAPATGHVHAVSGPDAVAESSSGVTKTFDHDAQGTRRGATVGGVAISYVVAGALWWRFVQATDKHLPAAAIDAAGVAHRLVTDQVGSLRLVVRASDGAVMQRMRDDAWGRLEEDFVEAGFARVPFAHERNSAGGLVDQVTGLVLSVHTNSGAKEYDPAVGRWVEKDPIRWGGGTTRLYEYVGNGPVGRVDPSGLVVKARRRTLGGILSVLDYLGFQHAFISVDGWTLEVVPCSEGGSEFPWVGQNLCVSFHDGVDSDSKCREQPGNDGADEGCLRALGAARDGGGYARWFPWSSCLTFDADALRACPTQDSDADVYRGSLENGAGRP
jgi:RHS repeat-associated protein